MSATDGWQCYRRKYGGIHSILVPLGDEWEWRHMDGDWFAVKTLKVQSKPMPSLSKDMMLNWKLNYRRWKNMQKK